MANVVFVDTWTAGMCYTDSVAKELSKSHKLKFLHFDSIVHNYLPEERSRAAKNTYEERSKNDKYYDKIIDYKRFGRSVHNAIKELDPDVAVFIAIHGFPMRWANYVCNQKGISTLHFMHGVKTNKADKDDENSLKKIIEKIPRIKYYTKLYIQYVSDFLFSYDIELPKVNKLVYDFYELIVKHKKYDYNPKHKHTVKYDTICMISETDKKFFDKRYNLNDSKKVVVGHTDMDKILEKREGAEVKDKVLYVSQPLTDDGVGSKEIVEKIMKLYNAVVSNNYQFVVRPHPRDNKDIINELKSKGVKISSNCLAEDILSSSIVAGVDSTLLLSAIKLRIPVMSVYMDGLTTPRFLERYDLHRRVCQNRSIGDVVRETIRISEKNERASRSNIEKPSKAIANEVNILLEKRD